VERGARSDSVPPGDELKKRVCVAVSRTVRPAAWLGNSTTIAAKHYLQITDDHFRRAAESAAFPLSNDPIDPDLQAIIDAWPTLPEAIKVGILAMVKAAGG